MATERLVSHDDAPIVVSLAVIVLLLFLLGSWISLG